MIAAAAEVVQQHIQAFGFRNEYGGTHERAQVDGRIGDGKQEVLGQQYAHDVVPIVFKDRKAGMPGFDDLGRTSASGLLMSSMSILERGTMMSATEIGRAHV